MGSDRTPPRHGSMYFLREQEGQYEGSKIGGVREGRGQLVWSNGDRYSGDFQNGLRHGQGATIYYKMNGEKIDKRRVFLVRSRTERIILS